MAFWQQVMEESHVNLYHAIGKNELVALRGKILSALPDSVTPAQASFAVSELIGAVNEGHIGFATGGPADSLYLNDALRFPYLLTTFDDGGFVVQRDLSSLQKLPAGSRIVSVNGKSATEIYQRYARFFGGLDDWKKVMIASNIRKLLYLDGVQSPFAVTAIAGSDTVHFTVPGYTKAQADSINGVLRASTAAAPFSLSFTSENSAVMDFTSMNGNLLDSFARFLRRSFTEIKRRGAKGLVVDLRKNGGGDSGLGEMLLDYINKKPYRMAAGVRLRVSKHTKAWAALLKADDPFKSTEDGTVKESKATPVQPKKNPLRFTGPVAVLIGTGTFSSANMLANAIKDYKLATLIGESTAEPANDFGEIFQFMLPNTHIVARGAVKQFVRANGDDKDFSGIHPDIIVKENRSTAGGDVVLREALKWINEQRVR